MQTEEKLYQYLEESGCFRRVLVVLVDTCASFDCGPSGCEPDGAIVLGGYEVQAQARSITPMAETCHVNLCFQTENCEESQRMLTFCTPGAVLQIESKCWSMCDGEVTFYVERLASVERVPEGVEKAYKAMLSQYP